MCSGGATPVGRPALRIRRQWPSGPAAPAGRPEHHLDAPVLRAPLRRAVRRERILLAVRVDPDPSLGEVHRRLVLQPVLHGERARLRQRHVRRRIALAVRMPVDRDDRPAGDEEIAAQLVQLMFGFRRERRFARVKRDGPRAAADDVPRRLGFRRRLVVLRLRRFHSYTTS